MSKNKKYKSNSSNKNSDITSYNLLPRFEKFFVEVLSKELEIKNLSETVRYLGFRENKFKDCKYFLLYTWGDGMIAGQPSSEQECKLALIESMNHEINEHFLVTIWDIDSCKRINISAEISFENE